MKKSESCQDRFVTFDSVSAPVLFLGETLVDLICERLL
jgi:hypothetical protein